MFAGGENFNHLILALNQHKLDLDIPPHSLFLSLSLNHFQEILFYFTLGFFSVLFWQ